jgi:hypothetical protein
MAAGSTYTPIATTTLGSDTASFTFSSIPSTYTDLHIVFTGLNDNNTNAQMQFNGDTGTNYSDTWLGGSGTAAASGRQTSTAYILWGSMNSTEISTNTFDIMDYSNTTTYKTALIRASNSGASGGQAVSIWVGLWRSTAAITSITFLNNSTYKYKTGTTVTIYGIKAA